MSHSGPTEHPGETVTNLTQFLKQPQFQRLKKKGICMSLLGLGLNDNIVDGIFTVRVWEMVSYSEDAGDCRTSQVSLSSL